jgi:hypothetical protein
MTDKPRSKELAKDAIEFVKDNSVYLREYAMPVVIPLMLMQAMEKVGPVYWEWFNYVAAFIASYFNACFMLAWHRAALLGPKSEHKVNPFALKVGEGKFILIFFGIALICALVFAAGFWPLLILSPHPDRAPVSFMIFLTVLLIIVTIISLRLMFMLPARSVNSPIGIKESWRISRGLAWRLFAGSFRTTIMPMLLITVFALVAGAIAYACHFFQFDEEKNVLKITLPGAVIMAIGEGIPFVIINFIIVARAVTILSRLYQWSVQNVPQPTTTS